MSLEAFPPVVMISARFLTSGVILLIGAKLLGATIPRGRELLLTAVYGVILLGGGTGALVFAEQTVPSGLAALMIVTTPFWMVGLEAAFPGGVPLHVPTLGGIAIGFVGVVILIAPAILKGGMDSTLLPGFLLLQLGCVLWCMGAILQKRHKTTANSIVNGAVQQVATGLAYLPFALLTSPDSLNWNQRSEWAMAYLVVFGSILGYSSFLYALEHLPVAIVSTYTYVNPLVAMTLGWIFYREPFGAREAAAMMVIFLGVAVVKWATREKA
jgi:drug/metabolite transporter (DMT)-like permease